MSGLILALGRRGPLVRQGSSGRGGALGSVCSAVKAEFASFADECRGLGT